MRSNQSVDSTDTQAANLDGVLCLRDLLTGADAAPQSLQVGIRQTLHTGNLQGRPVLIVQGRNDALLPVNHGSRPYLGLNAKVEDGSGKLSYIEVMNAQHLDSFINLVPNYDTLLVPLVLYEQRALDAMYANLKNGTLLSPSQVVRTTPRGGTPGAAPTISAANLLDFTNTLATGDRISVSVSGGVVTVPVPNWYDSQSGFEALEAAAWPASTPPLVLAQIYIKIRVYWLEMPPKLPIFRSGETFSARGF